MKYNEFVKKFKKDCDKAGKKFTQEAVSKAWTKHKEEAGTKSDKKAIVEKKSLPEAIKKMNKELTDKNNLLQELREKKQAGKDVKAEIKAVLQFLKLNRDMKKEKMTELGL